MRLFNEATPSGDKRRSDVMLIIPRDEARALADALEDFFRDKKNPPPGFKIGNKTKADKAFRRFVDLIAEAEVF